jgi:hypothetical protein
LEVKASDIHCPIPSGDRAPNLTGIQCVWCSLQTIGRWAGEEKLYNLTDSPRCKSYAGPGDVAEVLGGLRVKYKQSSNKAESIKLIKEAVKDGRACGWGMKNVHMMVLCHYDEDANRVHFIDNMKTREVNQIQILTVAEFMKIWDGWVVVIYPEKEIFPSKIQNREIRAWYYAGKQ